MKHLFIKIYDCETFFKKVYIKLVEPRKHLKIKKMPYVFTYFILFFFVISNRIRDIVTEKAAFFLIPKLQKKTTVSCTA